MDKSTLDTMENSDSKGDEFCLDLGGISSSLSGCFEGLEHDFDSDEKPLEDLLNNIGSARKWFNQLTRPTRQFIHTDDFPDSTVTWIDDGLHAIPKEVNQVLLDWKTKSHMSKALIQQVLKENKHVKHFPRPDYMNKLEIKDKKHSPESIRVQKTPEPTVSKTQSIVLGTYQQPLRTARTEEDKKVTDIVNSLPDLSFLLLVN